MRHVIGCMSGTSLDGLDIALIAIEGFGLAATATCLGGASASLGSCADIFRQLAEQKPVTAAAIAQAQYDFAIIHTKLIRNFCSDNKLDLIAVHGQTIYHAPPITWQLFQPAPLVAALQCPVVWDLRMADVAHGGQGAPITPLADWLTLRDEHEDRAVVNLGGFCNITLIPANSGIESIRGFDVCACNHVLDTIARLGLQQPYDADGQAALSATADAKIVTTFVAILQGQHRQGRSLGTGDECVVVITALLATHSAAIIARSACVALAQIIADLCGSATVALAGGGARNQALFQELRAVCPGRVVLSDELGVPSPWREAMAMAILGALCQDRVAITLPHITNVPQPAPIAGHWAYPHHDSERLA